MVGTGVDSISFDQCLDLTIVEDEVPDSVAIIGNLDPVEILELASEKAVAEATVDLVTVMGIKRISASAVAVRPQKAILRVCCFSRPEFFPAFHIGIFPLK